MGPFDRWLFETWNGIPDSVALPFRFFSTALDNWVARAILFAYLVWLIVGKDSRRAGLLAALCWPLANGLTDILKHTFPFHRPIDEPVLLILRVGASHSAGTASAHAANMIFVAWIMGRYLGSHAPFWFLIAGLVGVSRVVVGAHFPSQVLLGWLCGTVAAFVVIATESWISNRRVKPSEERQEGVSDQHSPSSPSADPQS